MAALRGESTMNIGGERQRRQAGLERRVPAGELQVQREQEEPAEHHEERRRDDRAADAEAAVGEVRHRQHRVRAPGAPSARTPTATTAATHERADHERVGPAPLGALDDAEQQRGEADQREHRAAGSSGVAESSRDRGLNTATATAVAATTGTLTRNAEPHQ